MSKRVHRLWPTVAAFSGLVLVFVGERVLAGVDTVRHMFVAAGAVAILVAFMARVASAGAGGNDKRPVGRLLALSTGGIATSMVLYGLLAYVVKGAEHERLRAVLWVAWPLCLAVSALPLAAIELVVMPVARTDRYEHRRVRWAVDRALGLALLLAIAIMGNYVAGRHDLKLDLSTGKKAVASEQTQALVRDLSQSIEVIAFFPNANDVAAAIEPYFESLQGPSEFFTVRFVDQALANDVASEASVSENGYVVVRQEKQNEKIRLGTTLDSARSALKTFDANFAKAVVKVSREKATAYFTVGHGERSVDAGSEEPRSGLGLLKQQLTSNKFEVKSLGIAEGLGSDVPADASLIFIMGPEKPFLPEETASLIRAFERGVRVLIALESEREGDPMTEVLAALGLQFDKTPLVSDKSYVVVTRTPADRTFIYSNRYSSHASVTTMTRHSSRLATLFATSGSLDKLPAAPPGYRVDVVLTSLDETFRDANKNFEYDESEVRKSYGLAAAVARTSTASPESQTRVFVHADVDTFTDKFVRYQGNPFLLGDIIYWLRDVKEPVLPTVSEEDVRIVHKRDEDAWWFYSTTFGIPAVVLGFGLLVGRRRRR